jgi:hypothetical protein
MTLTNIDSGSAAGLPIMPPFTPDPYRPGARLTRRLILAALIGFCFIWGFGFALFAPGLILFFAAPAVILAIVVVWALPDSRSPPVGALGMLLTTFMACLVLWPSYMALALPGLPWITMTRLTGFPMVFILLICASTSSSFRAQTLKSLKASPIVSTLMIGFVALQFLSIGLSYSLVSSFNGFLNAQINWTTIFFASAYVFQKPGRTDAMIRLLWWTTLPIGLIAIVESREQHVLWAGHIPSFLQINDISVQLALAGTERAGAYRAESTFSTPLGLAEFLSLVLPFVANYALGSYKILTRGLAVISIPFILYIVYLSGSRLGLVGAFVGLALSGFLWTALRWRDDRTSFISPLITMAFPLVFGAAVASTFVVSGIRHIVWNGAGASQSTFARNMQYHMAWPKILARPWGYGIGNAADVLGFAPFGILSIDSYYLTIVLDFGVVGFLIYYGMFIVATVDAVRRAIADKKHDPEIQLLKPLAIALVVFFIIKSVFSEIGNHPVVFMMLGMILALISRAAAAPSVEVVQSHRTPGPARYAGSRTYAGTAARGG